MEKLRISNFCRSNLLDDKLYHRTFHCCPHTLKLNFKLKVIRIKEYSKPILSGYCICLQLRFLKLGSSADETSRMPKLSTFTISISKNLFVSDSISSKLIHPLFHAIHPMEPHATKSIHHSMPLKLPMHRRWDHVPSPEMRSGNWQE